jgi:hypothetical protein
MATRHQSRQVMDPGACRPSVASPYRAAVISASQAGKTTAWTLTHIYM